VIASNVSARRCRGCSPSTSTSGSWLSSLRQPSAPARSAAMPATVAAGSSRFSLSSALSTRACVRPFSVTCAPSAASARAGGEPDAGGRARHERALSLQSQVHDRMLLTAARRCPPRRRLPARYFPSWHAGNSRGRRSADWRACAAKPRHRAISERCGIPPGFTLKTFPGLARSLRIAGERRKTFPERPSRRPGGSRCNS